MQIVKTVAELRQAVKAWRSAESSIAFVPTMGSLHAGHLKLVEEAKNKADKVVVSIFVNPIQFGVGEDFDTYPRTEQEDREKLVGVKADLLFLPAVSEIYAADARTIITVTGLSELHCGAFRLGHFAGVATVVCKLFNMVQPDKALFGLKDFQQFTIIKTMIKDLNIDVEIIGVETVREESGLALSSRNNYLTAAEKSIAPMLYQSLCSAREAILAAHLPDAEIEQCALLFLKEAGFNPEYFSICRASDLSYAKRNDQDLVLLAAAKLGTTRLIDNLAFTRK